MVTVGSSTAYMSTAPDVVAALNDARDALDAWWKKVGAATEQQ